MRNRILFVLLALFFYSGWWAGAADPPKPDPAKTKEEAVKKDMPPVKGVDAPQKPGGMPSGGEEMGMMAEPPSPARNIIVPTADMPASLIRAIEQRNVEIDQREKMVRGNENRVKLLEEQVMESEKKLTALHDELEQRKRAIEDKELELGSTQEQHLAILAKTYSKMPPDDAAARLERMDETLAVEILRRNKEKTVAKILAGIHPVRAARITERLSEIEEK